MTKNDWNKIEQVGEQALTLPDEQQQEFIRDQCQNNTELIKQVYSFLQAKEKADDFFSTKNRIKNKLAGYAASNHQDLPKVKSLIGETIGSYKLIELLGDGGMGAVYLAERADGQFEHTVAIKIIKKGFKDSEIYTRFILERQILAALNHENIARLFDGGVTDNGIPYLIMEYADGIPIDTYCNNHKLSVNQRLDLFKKVCGAAKYAHKNLVIHRDLKPENILITDDGVVKIMDFGIAKLMEDKMKPFQAGREYEKSGFLSFSTASPEQIAHKNITTSTDIYALGTLLCRLLAGVHPLPLEGKQRDEVFNLIKQVQPKKPSEIFDELPENQQFKIAGNRNTTAKHLKKLLDVDLDSIILKCLNKLPAERYQTIEDLSKEIDRYRSRYPVEAVSGSNIYLLNKFLTRNKTSVIFSTAFLALSILTVLFYTQQIQQERDIAQLEANKANQVTNLVLDLFKGSDPTASPGDTISARDLLNRGIERISYLENQPEIKANMLEVLGRILMQLGEYDESNELIMESLNIRWDTFGEEHLETVSSMEQLGTLLSSRGNLFEAEFVLERAINIRQSIQRNQQAALSEANTELGYVYRRLGKLEKAETLYRELIDLSSKQLGSDDPLTLLCISSLGVTLQGQGKLDEAEIYYRDVLEKRHALYGEPHPDVAMSMNNLATLLLNKGEFYEAEQLFKKSLSMRKTIFGNIHPKVALTTNNLGLLKRNTGQFEEADSLFNSALQINKSLFGTDELQTAINLFSIAELRMMMRKYEEALELYKQSNRIFKEHLPGGSSFIARSTMGIGESHLNMGDPETAEEYILSGFERIRELHPETTIEYGLAAVQVGKLYLHKNNVQTGTEFLEQAFKILTKIEGEQSIRANEVKNLLQMTTENRTSIQMTTEEG